MFYLILNLGYFWRMDPHLVDVTTWVEVTTTVNTCRTCHLHAFVFCKCVGVLHTHWHGLAAVECTDGRLSLGVCGELDKSAA